MSVRSRSLFVNFHSMKMRNPYVHACMRACAFYRPNVRAILRAISEIKETTGISQAHINLPYALIVSRGQACSVVQKYFYYRPRAIRLHEEEAKQRSSRTRLERGKKRKEENAFYLQACTWQRM